MEAPSITWPEDQDLYIEDYQVPTVRKKPRSAAQIKTLEKAKAAAAKGREERRRALFETFVDEKQENLKKDILTELEKRLIGKPAENASHKKEEDKPTVSSAPSAAVASTPTKQVVVKQASKYAKYF